MSIEKINQGDQLTQSMDLVYENIQRLKELFPEIVTEGKIDFAVLQEVLGNELEEGEEYYRFTWAGKTQARREAHKPSTGTLRPAKDESVNWDTTENLYIEGDNLEVLKLLQKSYAGKIKVISIDPPYNTGKDFVYKDNYKDNLKNYQQITGQIDSEGKKVTSNTETDGRYHSNWLNMIYPRLILARNLLREDGLIFINIDDNELENLIKIGKEVFGSENFIDVFSWAKTETPANLSKKSKKIIEYVICFQKKKDDLKFTGIKKESQSSNGLLNQTNKISELIFPSDIVLTSIQNGVIAKGMYGTDSYDVELIEDTEVKDGVFVKQVKLKAKFKWSQSYLDNEINNGTIIKIPTIRFSPSYEKLEYDAEVPPNLINSKVNVGTNENAGSDLVDLMGAKVFDFPKPVSLLKYLIQFIDDKNALILDFFSGSGTLANSVMELNLEDGGSRKFICVQLPEKIEIVSGMTDDEKKTKQNAIDFLIGLNKPTKLSEIGKERIRRARINIILENKEKAKDLDLGFKVFKLDSSNVKGWDGNPDELDNSLFDAQDNIKTDRTEEDVLFEILLKYGLDLTLPIEEKLIEGKKVFNVGVGALFICLADGITSKVAEGVGAWKQELQPEACRVIFKDTGFTDVEKTNSVQILKRFGITEVKSI